MCKAFDLMVSESGVLLCACVKPRGTGWLKRGAARGVGLGKADPCRAAAFPWGAGLGSVVLGTVIALLATMIK